MGTREQVNKEKEIIHRLYLLGKPYREIAAEMGKPYHLIFERINRYQMQEPEKWPKVKKKKNTTSVQVKVEVHQCRKCHLIFAVEEDEDLKEDVACPICWESEHLQRLGDNTLYLEESALSIV
jgi:rubrerythrin